MAIDFWRCWFVEMVWVFGLLGFGYFVYLGGLFDFVDFVVVMRCLVGFLDFGFDGLLDKWGLPLRFRLMLVFWCVQGWI